MNSIDSRRSFFARPNSVWLSVAVLCITVMAALQPLHAADNSAENNTASAMRITTSTVKQANWPVVIPAQGNVVPWEIAIISNKTNNIATTSVDVVEGSKVNKGDVLATFDIRMLDAEYAQARANLALAEANFQLAKSNLQRAEDIKDKQSLSVQDLQITRTQLETARASKSQAEAALRIAGIKLEDSVVKAPDDGSILRRNINLGEIPQAGQLLFSMVRQGKLEWLAQFDARQLPQVSKGMTVSLLDTQHQLISGKVRSISPQLDDNTKLASVRVELDDAANVAVNSYLQGNITVGNTAALYVPASSIVIKDGKTWLFRISNNVAEQVSVTLGRRQSDAVEVLSGIRVNDVIALQGAGFLNDHDHVVVTSQSDDAVGAQ